ncbi:MAG: hypothetical protein JNL72_04835 [Flavipsychrobacter sp.]|nr:hypothetical protein [Flavipsychrobacter sp.]
MNLQYISDNKGQTTAVQLQIPIEEWERLKKKYKELEEEEEANSFVLSDWHLELVRKEVQNVKDGTVQLTNWDEAKIKFKFKP